jgi:hypothetical protein
MESCPQQTKLMNKGPTKDVVNYQLDFIDGCTVTEYKINHFLREYFVDHLAKKGKLIGFFTIDNYVYFLG